ncbi:MAG TPA: SPOR domain-containing protein [Rhizomicrobium sp.]|nr:SPOR domain-containing protein [Rhizomicrobium sp.]
MLRRPRAMGALRKATLWLSVAVAACLTVGLAANAASASIHRHRYWQATRYWHPARPAVRVPDPNKDAALIVDGETGKFLYTRNADALRHPASLTKMMTLYLLFEQLKSGQMTLDTPLCATEHAAVQAPTKLNLRPGTCISADTAIKAIVVLSANDVAVDIAESIGGTEQRFAEMMTAKARAFGMTQTYYHNASGLPDPLQITTAGDLAILARHLAYDFPQYFHYFSTYSFSYRGITHLTHDNLIGRYQGADGIKTGYTGASGFNLVSSVVRNGVHIIGVVMGGTTARHRDSEMMRLLDDTFAQIGRDPQLVARANVPWQTLAENNQAKPVIAGFQFGNSSRPAAPPVAQILPAASARPSGDDEEAAELRPDPIYDAPIARIVPPPAPAARAASAKIPPIVMASLAPPAAVAAQISKPSSDAEPLAALLLRGTVVPTPQPKPRMMMAALDPAVVPAAKPRLHDIAPAHPDLPQALTDAGASVPHATVGSDWTIQIGAYADENTAKSELAAYSGHAADILGEAARIVAPFQNADGHVLYRARFGPFAENKARQVCELLTRRGQTCFAAIASR